MSVFWQEDAGEEVKEASKREHSEEKWFPWDHLLLNLAIRIIKTFLLYFLFTLITAEAKLGAWMWFHFIVGYFTFVGLWISLFSCWFIGNYDEIYLL